MNLGEIYASLGTALGVGLLIGLQRAQVGADDPPEVQKLSLGTIRTHPLVALTGGLAALLARQFGAWSLALAFLAVVGPILIAFHDDVRSGRDRGMTTEAGFIATFLLGALAASPDAIPEAGQRALIVSSVGVVVAGLLSLKRPIHEMVRRVSSEDVYATLKFAVVALILLPILPNQAYGPLAVLNPYKIGWMVMLIAGVGFLGYIAIRVLGAGKGLGVTGLLGGIVSSTAVTLAFAGRSRQEPAIAAACALGVVLANTVMPVRVMVNVTVVNPDMLGAVALPMGGIALAGVLVAGALYLRGKEKPSEGGEVKLQNPFRLGAAFQFGLLYAAILFACKAATTYLPAGGVYLAGILAGTTDVDAISLSMANLAKEGSVAPPVAATTILLAVATNSVVKLGMALSLGGPGFRRSVALAFALMLLMGGAGAGALWLR